jgi:tripartite-type tricarboxylate transporter receptor subunit TctC
VNRLLAGPALVKRLQDQAVTVHVATPEAFQAHVEAEIEKWTRVVQQAHLPND